jgi:integrase
MANGNSKRRYLRKHVSPRSGTTSFSATVRVAGFKSATKTFPTKAAAAEWAETTEELLRKQKQQGVAALRRDVAKLTLGELLLEWLSEAETQKLRSYDGAHQMASWWIQELGAEKALGVGVLALRAARDKLTHGGRAAGTVNRYLIVLRSAWNWARTAGLLPPERQWPQRLLLREPPGRTRFLSDGEIQSLLKAASAQSAQMHAAITVSIASGLRGGELLALDWSDVDLGRQTVTVRRSKTDRMRQVHLTQAACNALKALQGDEKVRAIAGPVFTAKGARLKKSTLEARWRRVREAAGLADFHWHDMRHTTASILAQQGSTLLQIAEVMGHRSLNMVQRYSHLVQGAPLPAHAALDAKLQGVPK